MHPKLAELHEYLSTTRADLVAAVVDLSPAHANQRPNPDAWSVAEILDHLRRVERGTIVLLQRLIAQAKAQEAGPEDLTESVMSSLDKFHVVEAPQPVKAPERVAPTPNVPVRDSLLQMEQSREQIFALMKEADGLALNRVTFDHPFMGPLDGYQWILILGQHEARHTRQVRRTRERLRA